MATTRKWTEGLARLLRRAAAPERALAVLEARVHACIVDQDGRGARAASEEILAIRRARAGSAPEDVEAQARLANALSLAGYVDWCEANTADAVRRHSEALAIALALGAGAPEAARWTWLAAAIHDDLADAHEQNGDLGAAICALEAKRRLLQRLPGADAEVEQTIRRIEALSQDRAPTSRTSGT